MTEKMIEMTEFRQAGHIKRYHTWPTIQQQDVASHTWQVMRIWFELFGPMSTEVSTYILLHDVGEQATGDVVHTAKRTSPDLKGLLDELEENHTQMLLDNINWNRNIKDEYNSLHKITVGEKKQVKICDLIEAAEFAVDEVMMGNRFGLTIFHNIKLALEAELESDCIDTSGGNMKTRVARYFSRLEQTLIRLP